MRLAPGRPPVTDALDDPAFYGGENPGTQRIGVRRISDTLAHILGGEFRPIA
jgi:hypothetical protein